MSCTQGKVSNADVIAACEAARALIISEMQLDISELRKYVLEKERKGFLFWKRPLTEAEVDKRVQDIRTDSWGAVAWDHAGQWDRIARLDRIKNLALASSDLYLSPEDFAFVFG